MGCTEEKLFQRHYTTRQEEIDGKERSLCKGKSAANVKRVKTKRIGKRTREARIGPKEIRMEKTAQKTVPGKNERDELVLTPGGWRPRSRVHHVEPDHHVSAEGGRLKIVHSATGRIIKDLGEVPRARAEKAGKRALRVKPAERRRGIPAPAPITDGWIINTEWTNTSGNPISYFSASWIVPPAPGTDNGQLVYLFNGIQQNSGGPFILQPVLQWGSSPAGGGKYWSITNWYVDGQGGTALHGNLVQVNPGDVIQGIMTLTGQTGTQFSYLSSFSGHPTADLTVNNIDELHWANVTLECYGFKAFTDYPDTALTPFYDIEIKLRTQTTPTVIDTDAALSWIADDSVTDNGQHCVIVSDDSPGGDVYLCYRNITQDMYFVNDKSTFGKDEVNDVIATAGGKFFNAFWVVLEGFTVDQLSIDQPSPLTPLLAGHFNTLSGVTISPNASGPDYELPGDLYTPQRIRFPFDIQFTSAALASFPNSGDPPAQEVLDASMTIGGSATAAATLFELVAGADPYFTNVDPTQENVFYLSQDLRVFSAAPAVNSIPVAGGPTFATDSIAGAYDYAQNLLSYLNTTYANPSGADPFNSVLPGQSGALTGDSSVTPLRWKSFFPPVLANNYNFAIARVRLRGTSGSKAENVKVFFRLWSTQSADTDYQPGSTYLSNLDSRNLPASPLPATDGHTIPFFATGNGPDLTDPNNPEYGSSGINNRTIQITSGDGAWAYFGCFLNVFDSGDIVNGSPVPALLNGTHHCVVAQIAYDDAPIINANGVTMSPENSDKLAQRNLQITYSANPGVEATHRIPQTFDTRPSLPVSKSAGALLNYPDELMIDWGSTPVGSTARIYWPQVDTTQVLKLASQLYNTHLLSAPDHNTVECKVTKGVTYVPIPAGSGQNFAGLLTVDLPPTVKKGQEYNILIRRITTRQTGREVQVVNVLKEAAASNRKWMRNWRYVVGTFQVKIPVTTKEVMLYPEETTLAILKWRLQAISPTSRWYPVLKRYISYISARVDGLGGNSEEIQPSLQGVPVKGVREEKRELTGKVCEVLYDCFGDFEGFVLSSCCKEHVFRSRERGIGELVLRACKERLTVVVWVEEGNLERICRIAVRC